MPKKLLKDLDSPEKNALGDRLLEGEISFKEVLEQFKGGKRTLSKWVSKRRDGIWIHSEGGRPLKCDLEIEK